MAEVANSLGSANPGGCAQILASGPADALAVSRGQWTDLSRRVSRLKVFGAFGDENSVKGRDTVSQALVKISTERSMVTSGDEKGD